MKRPINQVKLVAITTGDSNGIGLEVATKALSKINPILHKNGVLFILFRSKKSDYSQKKFLDLLDQKYLRLGFSSLENALLYLNSLTSISQLPQNALFDITLSTNPASWVVEAALACKMGLLSSLVTGPLSKTLTTKLKGRPIGHTGIFRQLYPHKKFHMGFVGKDFNVLLATDHLPITQVERTLTPKVFLGSLSAALEFKKTLGSQKKVAVLGLNPHAGEAGLLGGFEKKYLSIIKKTKLLSPSFMSPDAAFLKKNWSQYSVFLALYHDQGLIPFKMHHGQESGVHITVGLPFVRTSVDHGTGCDIFNKNIANPNSMLDAIKLNLKLIGAKDV